ncbi:hypothetical protein [uncultured Methylophaga sp.]|uniref:hypothetical protein n=1 Tax=uncultured Methylophaga sp. TaxID=285271 RepID=UPI00262D8919|nr:hypothetical protein [uncultured Methylophaga sp.]
MLVLKPDLQDVIGLYMSDLAMCDENDKIREKQAKDHADFQEMYRYYTSESVKHASDKVFSATPEELAKSYKQDDYSA